jgi:hypothetical protein
MKLTYLQKALVCLAVLVLVVNLCCKKSALPPGEVSVNAIVINDGKVDDDSCGWLIKTDADSVFHPTNFITMWRVKIFAETYGNPKMAAFPKSRLMPSANNNQ